MAVRFSRTISDEALMASVGVDTFVRGRDCAREGRVSQLRLADEDGLLVAAVQGSRSAPYQTIVEVYEDGGQTRIRGACTCPVAIGCKHAVATILAARGGGAATAALATATADSALAPAWELSLSPLLQGASAEDLDRSAELGIQFEVVRQPPTRFATGVKPPRPSIQHICLRPVVPGARGDWIRTGVQWRSLGYAWPRPDPRQTAALESLRQAHQIATGSYSTYQSDHSVFLEDFGPQVWELLAAARGVGVAFVPARHSPGPVLLSGEPVAFSLDLTRDVESGGALLRGVVSFGTDVVAAADVHLIGHPAHGVMIEREQLPGRPAPGLLLARLAQPLSESLDKLVSTAPEVAIPASDLDRFVAEFYPRLARSAAVTSTDGSVELPEIEPPSLVLSVIPHDDHEIDLSWAFEYRSGDTATRVPADSGEQLDGLRDRDAELDAVDALLPHLASTKLAPPDDTGGWLFPSTLRGVDAATFIGEVVPALRDECGVDVEVTGPVADYRRSDVAPVVSLTAEDSPDESDWFDLGVTVSIDDEQVPFHDLFVALARGDEFLLLDSGTYFSLARPELDELAHLIDEARGLQDKESDGLRMSVYQAGLWSDLVALGVVERQSKRWARSVAGLLDVDSVPRPDVPAGLTATLRPYQHDGFAWLSFLREHGLGGILADDMGLGKTVQALALVCQAVEQQDAPGPFLVVAPTSVVHNWALEAARFAPGLRVLAVEESERRAGTPIAERAAGAHLVITSYALFRIDFDAYSAVPWAGLFLDEAQYVKNHQGKTYQCARKLSAPLKLAMTGTPLENSLMDLWSLLSIVAPGLFPKPEVFTEQFRTPIEKGRNADQLARLRRRIRPLMLRRPKEQVASELPPKQEQVLEIALQPKHRKVYETHLQRERQKVLGLLGDMKKNRFAIFRSLTLLRQLSLAASLIDPSYENVRSSKADAFMEQIDEVVREGHRALVFSQFTGFLSIIRQRLDAAGLAYCYLDGKTRDRKRQIDAFKTGRAPIFLISLKAGGFGLNLTEADYCFVLDPWWNPATEAQAVDRAHRIGQDKTVMVYRLVALDTIEEKVMELKARKQDLFNKVMDDDALLSAPLTADDIRGLFGI